MKRFSTDSVAEQLKKQRLESPVTTKNARSFVAGRNGGTDDASSAVQQPRTTIRTVVPIDDDSSSDTDSSDDDSDDDLIIMRSAHELAARMQGGDKKKKTTASQSVPTTGGISSASSTPTYAAIKARAEREITHARVLNKEKSVEKIEAAEEEADNDEERREADESMPARDDGANASARAATASHVAVVQSLSQSPPPSPTPKAKDIADATMSITTNDTSTDVRNVDSGANDDAGKRDMSTCISFFVRSPNTAHAKASAKSVVDRRSLSSPVSANETASTSTGATATATSSSKKKGTKRSAADLWWRTDLVRESNMIEGTRQRKKVVRYAAGAPNPIDEERDLQLARERDRRRQRQRERELERQREKRKASGDAAAQTPTKRASSSSPLSAPSPPPQPPKPNATTTTAKVAAKKTVVSVEGREQQRDVAPDIPDLLGDLISDAALGPRRTPGDSSVRAERGVAADGRPRRVVLNVRFANASDMPVELTRSAPVTPVRSLADDAASIGAADRRPSSVSAPLTVLSKRLARSAAHNNVDVNATSTSVGTSTDAENSKRKSVSNAANVFDRRGRTSSASSTVSIHVTVTRSKSTRKVVPLTDPVDAKSSDSPSRSPAKTPNASASKSELEQTQTQTSAFVKPKERRLTADERVERDKQLGEIWSSSTVQGRTVAISRAEVDFWMKFGVPRIYCREENCTGDYGAIAQLSTHLLSQHYKIRWLCAHDDCERNYSTKAGLFRHAKDAHGGAYKGVMKDASGTVLSVERVKELVNGNKVPAIAHTEAHCIARYHMWCSGTAALDDDVSAHVADIASMMQADANKVAKHADAARFVSPVGAARANTLPTPSTVAPSAGSANATSTCVPSASATTTSSVLRSEVRGEVARAVPMSAAPPAVDIASLKARVDELHASVGSDALLKSLSKEERNRLSSQVQAGKVTVKRAEQALAEHADNGAECAALKEAYEKAIDCQSSMKELEKLKDRVQKSMDALRYTFVGYTPTLREELRSLVKKKKAKQDGSSALKSEVKEVKETDSIMKNTASSIHTPSMEWKEEALRARQRARDFLTCQADGCKSVFILGEGDWPDQFACETCRWTICDVHSKKEAEEFYEAHVKECIGDHDACRADRCDALFMEVLSYTEENAPIDDRADWLVCKVCTFKLCPTHAHVLLANVHSEEEEKGSARKRIRKEKNEYRPAVNAKMPSSAERARTRRLTQESRANRVDLDQMYCDNEGELTFLTYTPPPPSSVSDVSVSNTPMDTLDDQSPRETNATSTSTSSKPSGSVSASNASATAPASSRPAPASSSSERFIHLTHTDMDGHLCTHRLVQNLVAVAVPPKRRKGRKRKVSATSDGDEKGGMKKKRKIDGEKEKDEVKASGKIEKIVSGKEEVESKKEEKEIELSFESDVLEKVEEKVEEKEKEEWEGRVEEEKGEEEKLEEENVEVFEKKAEEKEKEEEEKEEQEKEEEERQRERRKERERKERELLEMPVELSNSDRLLI